ncbi:MAG: hypothetical protein ABFQ95_07145 [Pseudomonadota bacterium]
MKKLLVTLFVLVILATGGYTGLWFYNAQNMQQEVESQIKQINEILGILVGGSITYSSLETTGFPFAITLNVHDPKLDALGHQVQSDIERISLSTNALGTNYSLTFHGDMSLKVPSFTQNSDDSLAVVSKGSDSVYNVHFNKGSMFKALSAFVLGKLSLKPWNRQDFSLEMFDSFSMQTGVAELIDKEQIQALYQQDALMINVDLNKLDEDSHEISFQGDMKNVEFTKHFDAFYAQILTALGNLENQQQQNWLAQIRPILTSADPSWHGKQNISWKVHYKGITNFFQPLAGEAQLTLDIENFDLQSDLGTGTLKGLIDATVGPQWMPQNASVKIDTTSKITAKYDDFMKIMVRDILTGMIETQKSSEAVHEVQILQKILKGVEVLAPKLSEWGESRLIVDGAFDGNTQEIQLEHLSFTSDFYGFEAKGKSKLNGAAECQLQFTLNNYRRFTHDLIQYARKWMSVLNGGNPDSHVITPEVATAIVDFLQRIAVLSGKKQQNAVFEIIYSPEPYKLQINNRDFEELAAAFKELLPTMPPLFQEATPAATS